MTYRVGSGEGYYGDDVLRALPMLERRAVDALAFEALSELTLAILRRQAQRDPNLGYTRDLELIARKLLPLAAAQGVPIVTNGGGLNPRGGAEAIARIAGELGVAPLRIAVVTGDDVLDRVASIDGLNDADRPALSANVYLGAPPIVEALERGAQIVVTGRVADPSLYLALLVHRFGWAWDDWDRLAAGTVCGHLLECTAQIVGGNSLVSLGTIAAESLAELGYPIAEVEDDGSFVVTKLPGTPGIVNETTVKEQLLYEIHDPRAYLTPDVVVDLGEVRVETIAPDRVRVSGVRGKPRPERLKCLAAYEDGFARELVFRVGAPDTVRKAEQLEAMLRHAWRGTGIERTLFERLGGPDELVVRAVFAAQTREPLERASRRALALGLSGPAGMALAPSSIGAQDRPLLRLRNAFVARETVVPHVDVTEAADAAHL